MASIDFAVFPIGDALIMGIEEAIEVAAFVQTTQVIGVHYDTFGFIKIDSAGAVGEFAKSGLKLHLPEIGGSIGI